VSSRLRASALSLVIAAIALAQAAGCGQEDRLTSDDFKLTYRDAMRGVLVSSAAVVPIVLGKQRYTIARGRSLMARQTAAGREAADTMESLDPPRDAETAVDGLVIALREQADRDQRAAINTALTAERFRRAVCCTSTDIDAAVVELAKLGYGNPFTDSLVSNG
jgi:hypothetical protein